MKKGFTLVELSIVLVIIGLLIGGILVGQTLIESTKIQAVVKQFSQYDVAVTNFKQKYKQLPGDTNLFTGMYSGNNDGFVNETAVNNYEYAKFWSDLSKTEYFKNPKGAAYVEWANAATVAVSENFTPTLNIEQNNKKISLILTYTYDCSTGSCTITATPPVTASIKNYYAYATVVNGDLTTYPGNIDPLKPTIALALDSKMDDAIPNSGNVYGQTNGGNTSACRSGAKYNTALDAYACTIIVKMTPESRAAM